jgi:beta-lactamase superfamily II metal-dependent hydrolase
MLIGTGKSWAAPSVSAALAADSISRLENVMATQDHDDHFGEMIRVLQ